MQYYLLKEKKREEAIIILYCMGVAIINAFYRPPLQQPLLSLVFYHTKILFIYHALAMDAYSTMVRGAMQNARGP